MSRKATPEPRLAQRDLAQAFTKFDGRERDILGRHVERVEELLREPINRPGKFEWSMPLHEPFRAKTLADAALDSALTRLRQLTLDKERGNFRQVLGLLQRHAVEKNTTESDLAIRVLDRAAAHFEKVHEASPRMTLIEEIVGEDGHSAGSRIVSPGEVLKDYVYGSLSHQDEDKREHLTEWTAFHKMTLIEAADAFTGYYKRFALGPWAILREPELFD